MRLKLASRATETPKAPNPGVIQEAVEEVAVEGVAVQPLLPTEMPPQRTEQGVQTEPPPPSPEAPSNSTVNPVPISNAAVQPLLPTKMPRLTEQGVQTEPPPPSPEAPSNSTVNPVVTSNAAKPLPSIPSNDDSGSDRKNIVFFGETGVGKSSVINMFREGTNQSDSEVIPISSGAVGCTFSSNGYEAVFNEERYMLWDTAGLNEGVRGTVTHRESVENLAMLLHNLGGKIHLLVYCIRGKRFRQVIKDNYELFYRRFCRSQVPIVVVITGLENEEPDMENWWTENEWEFRKYGLAFKDHACITATRGKATKDGGYMFDEEYNLSQERVRSLIETSYDKNGCPVFDIRNDDSDFQAGGDLSGMGGRAGIYASGALDNGDRRLPGSYPTQGTRSAYRSVAGPIKAHALSWMTAKVT
ncbi:hypothetical protein EST38_g10240 [Candolleomyces aberdarensis]|uniref:G domain-containing protein n=1 Tax=Candolleomyces aberdarensis TaxID=2316362 RepID=A0A4Q2D7W6_9AGAR|nr:hypothetical protein EST38_g10240 [Candolleomyces aberdarensis]